MDVKEDLATMQLLAACIFESKEMDNETAAVGTDVTIDGVGTTH